jgi:hypothetical protein
LNAAVEDRRVILSVGSETNSTFDKISEEREKEIGNKPNNSKI